MAEVDSAGTAKTQHLISEWQATLALAVTETIALFETEAA